MLLVLKNYKQEVIFFCKIISHRLPFVPFSLFEICFLFSTREGKIELVEKEKISQFQSNIQLLRIRMPQKPSEQYISLTVTAKQWWWLEPTRPMNFLRFVIPTLSGLSLLWYFSSAKLSNLSLPIFKNFSLEGRKISESCDYRRYLIVNRSQVGLKYRAGCILFNHVQKKYTITSISSSL